MKAKFEKRVSWNIAHFSARAYKNLHNLPHWHIEHELIYIICGCAEITVNNERVEANKSECVFVKSGETHHIKADTESMVAVIKIDEELVKSIVEQKRLVHPILKNKYDIKGAIAEIAEELKGREYGEIIADGIITRLIAHIFRSEATVLQESSGEHTDRKYKELLDLIGKNYTSITFKDAAKFMNLSEPYFCKYFKRISGIGFTDYLNTLRISDAIEKIQSSRTSITDVSIGAGFGTIRNFNRVFKAMTGYSPRDLPKNYVFIYNYKDDFDSGFDPTLNCSETVELDEALVR